MKKKSLAVVAIVTMLFVSMIALTGCGKKKDEANKHPLIGSWEYEYGSFTYEFTDETNGKYIMGTTEMPFTYEDKGDSFSILYEGNTTSMTLEYRIEGTKLIVKDSYGTDVVYNKK